MRRGTDITEAGLKDVARRIVENVRDWDIAQKLVQKVKHFWETGNKQDDLSQNETHAVYQRENYGDVLPLSKKRDVEIGWSDHAEYRSDLRDVPHEDVNQGIAGWLRERLMEKGPDRKTVQMKLPGKGTAVVDYDLTQNPADADVITVWASENMPDFKSKSLQRAIMRMLPYDRPDLSGESYIIGTFDTMGENLSIASSRSKSVVMEMVRQYQKDDRVYRITVERPGFGVKSWIYSEYGRWREKVGSDCRIAVSLGPPTLAALVHQMEGRVRLYSAASCGEMEADFIKHRMPMDRNLGTRVHRDVTKFHKPDRQKEKQRLREHEG